MQVLTVANITGETGGRGDYSMGMGAGEVVHTVPISCVCRREGAVPCRRGREGAGLLMDCRSTPPRVTRLATLPSCSSPTTHSRSPGDGWQLGQRRTVVC